MLLHTFPARLKLPTYATQSLGIFNPSQQNIVFPRYESQGVSRRGELFILWAALQWIRINIAFHIVHHLDEQAKHSKAVIATGGIVTALIYRLEL